MTHLTLDQAQIDQRFDMIGLQAQRFLQGALGIFVAAQPQIGHCARRNDDDHQKPDERAVPQRPFRNIEAAVHFRASALASSSLTSCPGRKAWTPAVTTRSPSLRPCDTTAEDVS